MARPSSQANRQNSPEETASTCNPGTTSPRVEPCWATEWSPRPTCGSDTSSIRFVTQQLTHRHACARPVRPVVSDLEQPEDCWSRGQSCQELPAHSASRAVSLELPDPGSPDTAAEVQGPRLNRCPAAAEREALFETSMASPGRTL